VEAAQPSGTAPHVPGRGARVIKIEIGATMVRVAPGIDASTLLMVASRYESRGNMITGAVGLRVLVATGLVDFKKGAEGPVALVREALAEDSFSGTIFVLRPSARIGLKLSVTTSPHSPRSP
jgi:hypothetical protein